MTELEIIEFIATNNSFEFNQNKALEEASEFMEAVLKFSTKHKDNIKRPTRNEILKEYGDFMYRGLVYLKTIYPELSFEMINEKVDNHIVSKLEKLEQYKTEGKYKGGL